jgi:hypothetical protein
MVGHALIHHLDPPPFSDRPITRVGVAQRVCAIAVERRESREGVGRAGELSRLFGNGRASHGLMPCSPSGGQRRVHRVGQGILAVTRWDLQQGEVDCI